MANAKEKLDIEEALKLSKCLITMCENEARNARTQELEAASNIIKNFAEKITPYIDYGNAHHMIEVCKSLNDFLGDADIQETERELMQIEANKIGQFA